MTNAELKFDTAIISDDLRQETSGKLILVGVYPGDIIVSRFPATFLFHVHAQGEVVQAGQVAATLDIEDEIGTVLFRLGDHIQTAAAEFQLGRFSMNFNAHFTVHRECRLRFIARVSGASHNLLERPVKMAPPRSVEVPGWQGSRRSPNPGPERR